jgi:hypothetical protein
MPKRVIPLPEINKEPPRPETHCITIQIVGVVPSPKDMELGICLADLLDRVKLALDETMPGFVPAATPVHINDVLLLGPPEQKRIA